MTDVVEIARKRRTLLQSEIAQLDRFLRMAAALQKYEHGGYDGRGRTPIRETVSAPSAAPVSPEPRILPSVPAAQPSAPVAQSSAPVEPAPLQASAVPQVPKKETPPAQTETAQTDTARTEAMQAEVMEAEVTQTETAPAESAPAEPSPAKPTPVEAIETAQPQAAAPQTSAQDALTPEVGARETAAPETAASEVATPKTAEEMTPTAPGADLEPAAETAGEMAPSIPSTTPVESAKPSAPAAAQSGALPDPKPEPKAEPKAVEPVPPASLDEDPVAKLIAAKAGAPRAPASEAAEQEVKSSGQTPTKTPWSAAVAAGAKALADAAKIKIPSEDQSGDAANAKSPEGAKSETPPSGPEEKDAGEEVLVLGKPKRPASGPVDIHVGQKLRQRRWMIGMSRQQLGDLVGVSLDEIRGYEMGTSHIDADRMWQIASSLDVPMSYFFEDLEGQSENGGSARSEVLTEADARKMMEGGASAPPRAVEAS